MASQLTGKGLNRHHKGPTFRNPYLTEMFTSNNALNNYGLRSSSYDLELPKCRTNYYKNSFAFSGVKVWNALPRYLKEERSLEKFKRGLLPALVK